MKSTHDAESHDHEGRRERKRRQTRERIAAAAVTLFLERGFDATTVDDIAAAADVSKRSFFDYFPTKEEAVLAWQDDFGAVLAAAVTARPAGEPLAVVLEEAMTASIAAGASPQALAVERLVRETPALRARDQGKYAKLEQQLAEALQARVPHDEAGGFRARLLAMVAIGALRLGSDDWYRRGRPEATEAQAYTRLVFAAMWRELRTLAESALAAPR